jgi:hypothetical protein
VGANGDDGGGRNSGSAYTFDLGCNTTFYLPANQWHQISLPCDPGQNNTIAAVFGDDITSNYATEWILYRYSGSGYVKLDNPVTDTLSQGVGYWIIQVDNNEKILDMPNNSTPAPITHPTGCLDTAKGCFEIPLEQKAPASNGI